jgi:hypothetical protein
MKTPIEEKICATIIILSKKRGLEVAFSYARDLWDFLSREQRKSILDYFTHGEGEEILKCGDSVSKHYFINRIQRMCRYTEVV